MKAFSLVLLASFSVFAQDPTPNSACGMDAVGYRLRSHQGIITKEILVGKFSKRYVNADGIWTACPRGVKNGEFPHIVLKQKDCPRMVVPSWVGETGYRCQPVPSSALLQAANVGAAVKVYASTPTAVHPTLQREGKRIYICQKRDNGTTGWEPVLTTCHAGHRP
jgi:hypothetical protein